MKSCVILQPSYIPWRGYFHQIQKADVFVFYDDVQYDKHGWRNRNQIATANGLKWLTIPVLSKGNVAEHMPINSIHIDNTQPWPRKHWESIRQNYSRAPFFKRYAPLVESFYAQRCDFLVDFTIPTTVALAKVLGLEKTQFLRSSTLGISGMKTDRILGILRKVGATHYISGPSAKVYLEAEKLEQEKINIEWMRYNYPQYEQVTAPFAGGVSIIDLLFMKGPEAGLWIWE